MGAGAEYREEDGSGYNSEEKGKKNGGNIPAKSK